MQKGHSKMQSHLYHSTPPRGIPKTITLGISSFLMALPGGRPYPIVNNQIQIPWQGIIRYPATLVSIKYQVTTSLMLVFCKVISICRFQLYVVCLCTHDTRTSGGGYNINFRTFLQKVLKRNVLYEHRKNHFGC